MKEYRKVVSFYYKGNHYNMYLDNNNKHFFLKVNDNNELEYLKIEELIELTYHFTSIPNVMNIKKNKKSSVLRIIPKVIVGGTLTLLTSTVLLTAISMHQTNKRIRELEENRKFKTEDYVSYNSDEYKNLEEKLTEEAEDLVVDTYLESERLNYLFIYDMSYLDKALDYSSVSYEEMEKVINNNNSISPKFKDLLREYVNSVMTKYPNADIRVLYENLKTLEVVECTKEELIMKSLSLDSYGCYIRTENKIYVLDDYEYDKKTWEYQVIIHEFSHCLRTAVWDKEGKEVKVQIEGQNFNNLTTAEALNSLFAVSLFDYEERDIAYQLQSNYHKVMIDSMDNYTLEDYVNHSLSYYADKLDEFNNDENYATVILELIEMQYDDYHSKSIYVEQEEYYPIYKYISNMYYKNNITSDMTYDDARLVTDSLLDKIMFDVPEEYNIDTNYFYEYLNEYCNTIGIDTNNYSR